MVPASLRVRRDAAVAARPRKSSLPAAPSAAPQLGSESNALTSVNAAPKTAPVLLGNTQRRPAFGSGAGGFDRKYEDFMHEMADLGALGA